MQTGNKGKIADAANQAGKNANYYDQHPPEVFFVQENGKKDLHSFLLNFIPTNPENEFGKDSIWTGKLYEWNLTGDTLLVQEINKSKINKRYGLKINQQNNTQQNIGLENGNIVTNLNNKKTSGAWADFWSKVAEIWGDIGEFFGVATYDYGDGRYEWDVIDWEGIGNFFDGIFGGGGGSSGGGSDSGSYGYTGTGYPIYDSYVPGYQAPDGGYGGGSTTWDPYYNTDGGTPHGGSNYSSSLSYLLNYIVLTDEQITFLQGRNDIAVALESYFESNGTTAENVAFAEWTVKYLSENTDVSFDDFKNEYLDLNFDNPEQGENVTLINNGIEVNDIINNLPPLKQIAYTKDRGNVEDLTFGTNHDASGVRSSFLTKSDPDLYTDMASVFRKGTIFDSESQQVAIRFIDIFYMTNTSNQNAYSDPILNQKVSENAKFIDFMKIFGDLFRTQIRINNGDINSISSINLGNNRPIFSGKYNMTHGLTILLNDTEQTKINLLRFTLLPNGNWEADFEVTIIDHFGLDKNDVLGKQHISDGFPAWWVLQHKRGKVPFITKVVVKKRLSGNIN